MLRARRGQRHAPNDRYIAAEYYETTEDRKEHSIRSFDDELGAHILAPLEAITGNSLGETVDNSQRK